MGSMASKAATTGSNSSAEFCPCGTWIVQWDVWVDTAANDTAAGDSTPLDGLSAICYNGQALNVSSPPWLGDAACLGQAPLPRASCCHASAPPRSLRARAGRVLQLMPTAGRGHLPDADSGSRRIFCRPPHPTARAGPSWQRCLGADDGERHRV